LIFESEQAGCSGCHEERDGIADLRDVSSRAAADRYADFQVPSLRSVGGTAPYFHDGRFATLGELLRSCDGTMGRTGQLSADEFGALEAYLRSL
jgi:cytochrome c peroxidase